jgi:hypothetical protein
VLLFTASGVNVILLNQGRFWMRKIIVEVSPNREDEIEKLRVVLGMETTEELFTHALGLLEWAVRQRRTGRQLTLRDIENQAYWTTSIPFLDRIDPVSQQNLARG